MKIMRKCAKNLKTRHNPMIHPLSLISFPTFLNVRCADSTSTDSTQSGAASTVRVQLLLRCIIALQVLAPAAL